VRDALLGEFPRRQPGTLQQRAGLVHVDVAEHAALVQCLHHAERGAPLDTGERAGVAVSLYVDRAAHVRK
jgi:hypothetical protein